MKNLFAVLFFLTASVAETEAQLADTAKHALPQSNYDLALKKARNQKTAAWLFLGGGTGLAIVSAVIGTNVVKNVGSQPIDKLDAGLQTGAALLLAGGACMVASIPFFISSGKNRKRASVLLRNESTAMLGKLCFKQKFPAISIRLTF